MHQRRDGRNARHQRQPRRSDVGPLLPLRPMNRCTVCGGLLVEDPNRPERERVFCSECLRPFCDSCQENHRGANDPEQHDAQGRPLR
jgi:hypothetical protein